MWRSPPPGTRRGPQAKGMGRPHVNPWGIAPWGSAGRCPSQRRPAGPQYYAASWRCPVNKARRSSSKALALIAPGMNVTSMPAPFA